MMHRTEIASATTQCVFCAIAASGLTSELLIYRDHQTAVFPSRYQHPRNQGQLVVVPVVHIPHIYDVEGILAGALMATLAKVARAVKHVCDADGISVRQNSDVVAAEELYHLHFEVVPRFYADGFSSRESDPFGALEVPRHERVRQASAVRAELRGPGRRHAISTPEALNRLTVRTAGRTLVMHTDEIDWIEAAGNYVHFHTGADSHLVRARLSALEAQLDPRRFARVHRCAIVNVDRVIEMKSGVRGEVIVLRDGTVIQVSAPRRKLLVQRLGTSLSKLLESL
jgi:diadenosine tetraphosphate (Ap4A) HIT family hydrolase